MLSKVKASSKLFIPIQVFWWICFLRSNFGANSTFLALMQMQKIYIFKASFCCCCSVIQSCPILCNPMDCSKPGFPVLHHLPELGQTHVHWVGDVIQPSHPLSSPSPPDLNLSQHQGLFQWVGSSHQMARVLELQPQHQCLQWIFRIDFL